MISPILALRVTWHKVVSLPFPVVGPTFLCGGIFPPPSGRPRGPRISLSITPTWNPLFVWRIWWEITPFLLSFLLPSSGCCSCYYLWAHLPPPSGSWKIPPRQDQGRDQLGPGWDCLFGVSTRFWHAWNIRCIKSWSKNQQQKSRGCSPSKRVGKANKWAIASEKVSRKNEKKDGGQ